MKAILFNYACHATTLSFYQWNGDWPGFAQIELEKAFPGATALFVAGCGADQNPLPRRTVELAEKYGRDICEGVVKLSQQKLTPVNDQFAVAYKEIPLALAELPTKKQIENDAAVADKFVASRARHLLRLIEANGHLEQTYPYPIQVWNLGGARLVFLGGEVVVDYSLRIKGDLETPPLWVAGYCNDVMAYIPSRRVLLEGGYEGARSMIYYGMPTVWAPEIENHIIEQVTQFVQQVDMP